MQGDADLTAGNIKQGVTLFGVDGTLYNAAAPKTGQTDSYNTGDDGDLEKGVAWPNPRFITGTTGIVTDTLTGLIWLKNANCTTFFSGDSAGQNNRGWSNALVAANSLSAGYCGLTDGSGAGDWRLPNVRELQSLAHYGYYNPAVPNTTGTGKWSAGDPFSSVQSPSGNYWPSSTYANNATFVWYVSMLDGFVYYVDKINNYYVWPVRGEQ